MQPYGAPPGGVPPPPPPLPPGWEVHIDPASRATYFLETATGRTQWTPPAAARHAAPPSAPQSHAYPAPQMHAHPLAPSHASQRAYPNTAGSVPHMQAPHAPVYAYPQYSQAPYEQQRRPKQPLPPSSQLAPQSSPPDPPQQSFAYPHDPASLLPLSFGQSGAAAAGHVHQRHGAAQTSPVPDSELRHAYPGGAPPPPPPELLYGPPLNAAGPLYAVAQSASDVGQLSHGMSSLMGAPSFYVDNNGRGQTLQLEMSAEGLTGKDLVSKSDPLCVVESWHNGKWTLVGNTETLKNTHKPHWSRRVNVLFVFESVQRMRFRVMDSDSGRMRSDDTLGIVEAPLADIVRAGATMFRLEKKKITVGTGKHLGTLTVRAHETDGSSGGLTRVRLQLSAQKLDRADGPFRKSDPYFVIEKIAGFGPGARSILCKSEVVQNSLSPSWRQVSFLLNSHGRPQHEVYVDIRIMDFDAVGKHDSLGTVRCSLGALAVGETQDVINEAKRRKKGSKYVNSGTLSVDSASVIALPSFVSYTMGGLRLRFTCAVDFTASNGKPDNPRSLHYSDGVTPSLYARALEAVGNVISPYLSDGFVEAFGFGATIGAAATPSFDFPLQLTEGAGGDPRVFGVPGLVAAYTDCVHRISFSGPTNFAPILSRVMYSSSTPSMPAQNDQHYTVLLILTDGQCTDLSATVDKIVRASSTHPLSIVIVGVGTADFTAMKVLDGDDKTLFGKYGCASRDIVQFVEWKPEMDPSRLASEVLAEIPSSVVEFMTDHQILPNAPGPLYSMPEY